MKLETLNKYIGTTHGVFTILELDHETYDKEKQRKRSYFKCLCNRCHRISIVRADHVIKSIPYKACCYCRDDLQREIAAKKYPKETKYERERINSIRSNANNRKIPMLLSKDEIKQFLYKPCYYCGQEKCMGVDRIDSSKGYTKENCVPCFFICNRIKNKYSLDVFLDRVEKIYLKHIKGSTTISKESTLQVNGNGSAELLTAA